jgi:F-type H+-transporting ATPase subunit a
MIDVNTIGPRIIIYIGKSGKFFITETVVYEFALVIILSALAIWMGSGLKKVPKGKQVWAELFVGWIYKFAEEHMSKKDAEIYAPYLGTLILWLFFCNSLGLIGLRPITADLNATAGMAILSFLLILFATIRKYGIRGKVSQLCDPYGFMMPMETISDLTLPVTLALRLFGNIFGGMIVVDLWLDLMSKLSLMFCSIPILRCVTVIPLNFFFDMFEPVIQAYVFTILTTANLGSGLAGISEIKQERLEKKKKKKEEKRQEAQAA